MRTPNCETIANLLSAKTQTDKNGKYGTSAFSEFSKNVCVFVFLLVGNANGLTRRKGALDAKRNGACGSVNLKRAGRARAGGHTQSENKKREISKH